jgi:hypothetical protein
MFAAVAVEAGGGSSRMQENRNSGEFRYESLHQ